LNDEEEELNGDAGGVEDDGGETQE